MTRLPKEGHIDIPNEEAAAAVRDLVLELERMGLAGEAPGGIIAIVGGENGPYFLSVVPSEGPMQDLRNEISAIAKRFGATEPVEDFRRKPF